MGNCCCFKRRQKKKIVLLLVGLDNAGKTVAAKNLAGECTEEVVPTVGFSVINLTYMGYKVKVFDLGGGSNIRGIWSRYFVDAHGILFVVDSSDYSRLAEVREVLHNLLSHEKITGKPLLLLANKQDNENALDEIDLIETLQLEELVNRNRCPTLVETCSATEMTSKSKLDPGIKKGYNWILNYIIRNYGVLNKRVEIDVKQQEAVEKEARQHIIERLRLINEEEKKKLRDDDAIELYCEYDKKINGSFKHISPHSTPSASVSEKSSESLPHVYYGTVNDAVIQERPKSATQIIKHQLELENTQRMTLKRRTNKTEPIHLLGVKLPHSAHETRTTALNNLRPLRSAGDSVFVVSELPHTVPYNAGDGDLHRQLFEMNKFDVVKGPKPQSQNGVMQAFYKETAISVVDVE